MRGRICHRRCGSERDIEALRIFDAESETGFLMEAIRGIVREVGPTVPVLGFAGAPWTLACYMIEGRTKEGFATVKALMWEKPRAFEALLKKIATATIGYLKAQIAAGAAAVQLFRYVVRRIEFGGLRAVCAAGGTGDYFGQLAERCR